MREKKYIGVDLGGTKVRASCIQDGAVISDFKQHVKAQAEEAIVLDQIVESIEQVWDEQTIAIGVGVPSIVDAQTGIVYDVQNIPSWKEVSLKQHLEDIFHVRTEVNNDANCFALGEKWFGKGRNTSDLIGLVIGTGIAGGIIINNRLYAGQKCGAGEFGMLPYKDHHFEYYCSGQFFTRETGMSGEALAKLAIRGDTTAATIFDRFGRHMGMMIQAILYSLAPEKIILGGSVSNSFALFRNAMFETLKEFAYHEIADAVSIEVSEHPDIAVLGAAALVSSIQK